MKLRPHQPIKFQPSKINGPPQILMISRYSTTHAQVKYMFMFLNSNDFFSESLIIPGGTDLCQLWEAWCWLMHRSACWCYLSNDFMGTKHKKIIANIQRTHKQDKLLELPNVKVRNVIWSNFIWMMIKLQILIRQETLLHRL